MSDITLTIDGKVVTAREGDTILDVCRKHGVDLPTLCYHEALSIVGACRLCVVEIEGARRLNSACTTPAADGMVVHTETEKLNAYRRMILELLFSERNHFCPACVMNGDCDLQAMAYRLGMDHVRYRYLFPKYEMDLSHPYIGMDPNRCILCTRCVRACDELAGIHTLDLKERGWQAQIEVDLRGQLGDSSCIACGSCVQLCPTGALFDKRSAYRSKRAERTVTKSVCNACSLGCGVEIAAKGPQLITVDGDFECEVNHGLLCVKGRFQTVENAPTRLKRPLVDGQPVTWDAALATIAERLEAIRTHRGCDTIAGVASPALTNETLFAFREFLIRTIGTTCYDTLYSEDLKAMSRAIQRRIPSERVPNVQGTLDDVRQADAVLLIGTTPEESHEVLASTLRRAAMARRTRLVIVNTRMSELDRLAEIRLRPIKGTDGVFINGLLHLLVREGWNHVAPAIARALEGYTPEYVEAQTAIRPEELRRAAEIVGGAQRPAILFGRGLMKSNPPEVLDALINLALLAGSVEQDRFRMLHLCKGGNARGAAQLGFTTEFELGKLDPARIRALYLLTGDISLEWSDAMLERLEQVEFLVVQGCYPGPLASIADVLLPATLWFERGGSMLNVEGRWRRFDPALAGSSVLKSSNVAFEDDWDVLAEIARQMGTELPFDTLTELQRQLAQEMLGTDRLPQDGTRVGSPQGDLRKLPMAIVDYTDGRAHG